MTFRPFVNVKYGAKLDEEADDVEGKLLSFLPKDDVVIKDESEWIDGFQKEQEGYKLPSSKFEIGRYKHDGDQFVIFKMSIAEDFTKNYIAESRYSRFCLLKLPLTSMKRIQTGKFSGFSMKGPSNVLVT